jgi:hypothetical protein
MVEIQIVFRAQKETRFQGAGLGVRVGMEEYRQ